MKNKIYTLGENSSLSGITNIVWTTTDTNNLITQTNGNSI